MRASTVVLIAVLVLIVALVIYAVAKDAGNDRTATGEKPGANPWKIYERTDGSFDEAAQRALHQVVERPDPAPEDHLLAATILARNVIGQEHRPQTDRAGRPTQAAQEQTRRRRAAYDQARAHYMRALEGLEATPQAMDAWRERDVLHARRGRRVALAMPAERIVDEALEFAFGGFGTLIGNDPIVAALFAGAFDNQELEDFLPVDLTLFDGIEGLFAVDTPLAEAAFRRQEDIVKERQAAAVAAAGGGGVLAAETFLDLSQQNTSDSQNVHDPGVIACNKAIIGRLREDQGPLDGLPTLDTIIADVHQNGEQYSEGRPSLIADALSTIHEARKGERVVSFDCTDEESLRRVWARADDPRNAAVRGKMRQALFDALVSAQKGPPTARRPECVYGRAEPQLSSLALLDWDRRNWVVKKLEQFKNEIFTLADRKIKDVARAAAAQTSDVALQSAGRHFLAESFSEQEAITVSPEAARKLHDDMRRGVSDAIDEYLKQLETESGIRGGIPEHMVDKVKAEALAAIMD